VHTLLNLTEPQRQGIIGVRARQVADELPVQDRGRSTVRELNALLAATTVAAKE
jgi:hypothetical protein